MHSLPKIPWDHHATPPAAGGALAFAEALLRICEIWGRPWPRRSAPSHLHARSPRRALLSRTVRVAVAVAVVVVGEGVGMKERRAGVFDHGQ